MEHLPYFYGHDQDPQLDGAECQMRCSSDQFRRELNFPGMQQLLITSRDKLTFYDFFCDFQQPPIEFHYFTLEFFTFLLVFFSFLLVFTCVPLVFTCVLLVFICVPLVFHLCSSVFYLCSFVFSCVPLVVFPLVSCFRLDQMLEDENSRFLFPPT